jgi:AcrR family transcriptional regulator
MSLGESPPTTEGPVRKRSTRDRPAKPPLSEDVVVDAALAILKSEGPDAVTMRRVAAALDTGPASLYAYVAGRDGLLESMLDRVVATVTLEVPDPLCWRAQLHSLLAGIYRALVEYPGIGSMTLIDAPTTEAFLHLNENLLGILLAGRLDPQDAAWACDIFALLVTSAAREDDVRDGQGREEDGESPERAEMLYKVFTGLSPERFPLITAHASEIVAGDRERRFRYTLDVVLDGMLARSGRR